MMVSGLQIRLSASPIDTERHHATVSCNIPRRYLCLLSQSACWCAGGQRRCPSRFSQHTAFRDMVPVASRLGPACRRRWHPSARSSCHRAL